MLSVSRCCSILEPQQHKCQEEKDCGPTVIAGPPGKKPAIIIMHTRPTAFGSELLQRLMQAHHSRLVPKWKKHACLADALRALNDFGVYLDMYSDSHRYLLQSMESPFLATPVFNCKGGPRKPSVRGSRRFQTGLIAGAWGDLLVTLCM